jgi:excisionase family DNA binding protein
VSAPIEIPQEQRRAFFTPDSLADYLSLSGRTVRDLLRHGVIPSDKIGGSRRVDPADVDAYLAEHRQEKAA